MEVILPDLQSEEKFLECATQLKYGEFDAKMFIFCTGSSDVDVYQLMPDDRLLQLLYGWEKCQLHSTDCITEEASYIVKVLAHHTLQLWFSQEWIGCAESLKRMVLYYLNKGFSALSRIEGLCDIDWPYILHFQKCPWRLPYLQQMFANLMRNKQIVIEHPVLPATPEDVTFLMQERLHLIILRLLKLFDAGSWEAVKQLSLRVLAAWLKCNASASSARLQVDKTSITLVAHLYLLTVFVADDNRGYAIDNMMYNIRFYAQTMQEAPKTEDINYTPARLIAHICVRLGLGKDGFFEHIVFKKFQLSLVTPFAVMLEAYTSYVLGNTLLELMALNEHDFMTHLEHFKVLMNRYIEERENSERFLLNELQKLESQRNSHALPHTVNLNLNYQMQICKGNRASNIGNYKNCDDDEKPLLEVDEELDRQIDPVFQNVPNNEEVLEFVYNLLAERNFRGWQFAKIALLLKIIGQKLNTIEVWRYHPGLTTQFMLSLEHKLANNYADLAKVFSEHNFMEAEFWLTAFYLHPTNINFNEVKRCSRNKKKGKEEDVTSNRTAARTDKLDHIKYELLSSTIDVDEIVAITNHNASVADYDPVGRALQALRLPRSILKDLLTVAFQPRNKQYSWALEWNALHERCSALLKSTDLKRKFVALNMAEANDRLKFLKIDYAKYKNRPQLDYGTIEEGYENSAGTAEADPELSAEEDEEAIQAAREKAEQEKKRKRNNARKFWEEIVTDDEEEEQQSDESEAYYTGTGRRTRVRAAALVASAMISDMDRAMRSGRRSPPLPSAAAVAAAEAAEEEALTEAQQQPTPDAEPEAAKPPLEEPNPQKRSFDELLQAQVKYTNETSGFKAFTDIWSFEKDELTSVKDDNKVLLESNTVMSMFRSLQGLRKSTLAVKSESKAQPEPLKKTENEMEAPKDPRISSRYNSEADSLNSGTSMEAVHDANEFNEEDTGVSKELTPPSAPSDFTMETEVLQLNEKVLAEGETIVKAKTIADYSSATSEVETLTATEVETDTEQIVQPQSTLEANNRTKNPVGISRKARLIDECLTRRLEVRLHRLSHQDIEKLRGLRVRVKRTNFIDYYRGQTMQRTAFRATTTQRRVSCHTEESSASTPTSDLQSGPEKRIKRFVHITSDTPEPAKRVAIAKPRFKQFKRFKPVTSDSSTSTDHDEKARPASKRRRRGHKWSHQANKANQAKVHQNTGHITGDTDVIELSSDSVASSLSPVPVAVNRFPQVFMPLGMDPLYEEEVVPF